MLDVFVDSLIDSLKIFGFAFITYCVVSFLVVPLCKSLTNRKISTLIGAVSGICPECAIPIISSNLFTKKLITYGSLIAVMLASSDEAVIILLANKMWTTVGYLILFKLSIAIIMGYLIDLIFRHQQLNNINMYENASNESFVHQHILHPLVDSLKIFIYAFIIIFIFGTITYFIGEENIVNFLTSNRSLQVLAATVVGLIPNCSGSIILTTLYIENGLNFSALLAGLLVNSGLGLLFLFRNGKIKEGITTTIVLTVIALLFGYIMFFMGY